MPNIGQEYPLDPTDPTDNIANRAEFIAHTNYLFNWSECEVMFLDEDNSVHTDTLTLEEALELTYIGYTAIPF